MPPQGLLLDPWGCFGSQWSHQGGEIGFDVPQPAGYVGDSPAPWPWLGLSCNDRRKRLFLWLSELSSAEGDLRWMEMVSC